MSLLLLLQNVINPSLKACLYRTILIRWCALLDLSIISMTVKGSPLSGHYIQQRLGIHLEQNRSQNGTLGYSIHKGARSRRNTINHNKLATITDT